IFVHCVVAMLHEHAREFTELNANGDRTAGVEPIHVLATSLPRRHTARTSIAGQHDALFKMNMDGVVPTTTAVDKRPDFPSARFGGGRDLVIVSWEALTTIGPHCPRCIIGAIGTAELERPFAGNRDLRDIRIRNQ